MEESAGGSPPRALRRPISPGRRLAISSLLAIIALAAVACGAPSGPRGWAGAQPVVVDGAELVLVPHRSRLYALPQDSSAVRWEFPPRQRDIYPISVAAREELATLIEDAVQADVSQRLADLTVSGPSGDALKDALDAAVDGGDASEGAVKDIKKRIDELRKGEEEALKRVRAIYGDLGLSGDASTVYVTGFGGWLYAIDIATGELQWLYDSNSEFVAGVAVDAGVLYTGTRGEQVFALDAATGQRIWDFDAGGEIWATPTVADDAVFVTSLEGTVFRLTRDGGEEWRFDGAGAGIASRPVVEGDTAFVGSFDNELYALDIATGDVRWSAAGDNWFWAAPVVEDGTVYAPSLDGSVYAFDAETGDARWPKPFDAGAPIRSSPVLVGGGLVVAARDGRVYKLDLATGEANPNSIDTASTIEANLAIDGDDNVYVRPRSAVLYILDATDGLQASSVALPN